MDLDTCINVVEIHFQELINNLLSLKDMLLKLVESYRSFSPNKYPRKKKSVLCLLNTMTGSLVHTPLACETSTVNSYDALSAVVATLKF